MKTVGLSRSACCACWRTIKTLSVNGVQRKPESFTDLYLSVAVAFCHRCTRVVGTQQVGTGSPGVGSVYNTVTVVGTRLSLFGSRSFQDSDVPRLICVDTQNNDARMKHFGTTTSRAKCGSGGRALGELTALSWPRVSPISNWHQLNLLASDWLLQSPTKAATRQACARRTVITIKCSNTFQLSQCELINVVDCGRRIRTFIPKIHTIESLFIIRQFHNSLKKKSMHYGQPLNWQLVSFSWRQTSLAAIKLTSYL